MVVLRQGSDGSLGREGEGADEVVGDGGEGSVVDYSVDVGFRRRGEGG